MSKEFLMESVFPATTINDAQTRFLSALEKTRIENPGIKICYVIGTVTSDGPEHIDENLRLLKDRSAKVAEHFDGIVFSAADLFNQTLFARFDGAGAKNQDYLNFWETIIRSGFITDIVRTPRWELSIGASHENRIANEVDLQIHNYLE